MKTFYKYITEAEAKPPATPPAAAGGASPTPPSATTPTTPDASASPLGAMGGGGGPPPIMGGGGPPMGGGMDMPMGDPAAQTGPVSVQNIEVTSVWKALENLISKNNVGQKKKR